MKLEVGDVKLDTESGVSFSSRTESKNTSVERPEAATTDVLQENETWVFAVMCAAGLVLAGALAGIAVTANVWMLAWPASLFALLAIGAGGLAWHRNRTGFSHGSDPRRVLQLVREMGVSDADALARRLGWTEPRLLEALVDLIESGEVEEDLDLETGRWIYSPGVVLSDERRKSLTAVDRLKAIEPETTGITIEE